MTTADYHSDLNLSDASTPTSAIGRDEATLIRNLDSCHAEMGRLRREIESAYADYTLSQRLLDDEVDLTLKLTAEVDSLRESRAAAYETVETYKSVIRDIANDRDDYIHNLASVHARCNELLDELRAWRHSSPVEDFVGRVMAAWWRSLLRGSAPVTPADVSEQAEDVTAGASSQRLVELVVSAIRCATEAVATPPALSESAE